LKTNRILAATLALVLIAGLGLPAFAQTSDPFSTETPATSAASASGSPVAIATSQACTLIDFEGVGDLNSVGTIGAATFGNAQAFVDSDAGGSGDVANEPSPDTTMISFFQTTFATVTLDNPASEIRVWHSTFQAPSEMRVFNAANNLLATIPLPVTPIGAGDPTGGDFGVWLQVIHSESSNVIKKVEFDGFNIADRTGYDDFEFCISTVVGGEIIPLESTSLILAGAQTFSWMIPVVLSVLGIGLFVVSRKSE